jgi:hypothetical protein
MLSLATQGKALYGYVDIRRRINSVRTRQGLSNEKILSHIYVTHLLTDFSKQ